MIRKHNEKQGDDAITRECNEPGKQGCDAVILEHKAQKPVANTPKTAAGCKP